VSSPQLAGRRFTDDSVQDQERNGTLLHMRDVEFIEAMCDRFLAAQEATGLPKKEFAESVGLTASQLTNIRNYRNPPPHKAIALAAQTYGLTTDFFYSGNLGGMRDQSMAKRLREILGRL
jgi:hypothetical protein